MADAIDDLVPLTFLDVTFCLEVEGLDIEAKMAGYFSFPESESADVV